MPQSGCSALHGVNPNLKKRLFISIDHFRILGTSIKMVTNMKLAFTNVPLRHSSAHVIQKWLRSKRLIIVRLEYIS